MAIDKTAAAFDTRVTFYADTITAWLSNRQARILVVGAEDNDMQVFRHLGFSNITLLNLGFRCPTLPEGWSFAHGDGHALPFPDGSFDAVVTHATLHHCRSPHRVLLEMYRVAREAVVFIEARDSSLMRWVEFFGVTQSYEVTAVFGNGGVRGGVDDTEIPNFVFRWTEREVEKTVSAYGPHVRHRYSYRYALDLPQTPAALRNGFFTRWFVQSLRPLSHMLGLILARQQNLFAARIEKPQGRDGLHPWLEWRADGSPGFDRRWAEARFRTAESGRQYTG
jgi:SAM-dependent methyltransferase